MIVEEEIKRLKGLLENGDYKFNAKLMNGGKDRILINVPKRIVELMNLNTSLTVEVKIKPLYSQSEVNEVPTTALKPVSDASQSAEVHRDHSDSESYEKTTKEQEPLFQGGEQKCQTETEKDQEKEVTDQVRKKEEEN